MQKEMNNTNMELLEKEVKANKYNFPQKSHKNIILTIIGIIIIILLITIICILLLQSRENKNNNNEDNSNNEDKKKGLYGIKIHALLILLFHYLYIRYILI